MSDELSMSSGALIFATLADVYLSSGMIDEAISILKDGLMRNPTYTLAKIILGRAYYIKGDIKEAINVLEQAYEEAKDSEEENLYLGHCYRKLGEYDKAMMFYEATLKINPENKEAKQELASLEAEMVSPKFGEIELGEERVEAEVEPKEQVAVPKAEAEIKPEVEEAVKPEEQVEVPKAEVTPEAKVEVPKVEVRPEEKVEEPRVDIRPEEQVEPPKAEVIPEVRVEEVEVKPVEMIEVVEEKAAEVTAVTPMPLESIQEPINRLLTIKTVKGVFISSKDGLLIQNYYKERTDIEEICAFIAAICNEADDSFKFLKAGPLTRCIIEKTDETICVVTAGDALLTVITEPEAKPGLIFVYARKIIEEIQEILR